MSNVKKEENNETPEVWCCFDKKSGKFIDPACKSLEALSAFLSWAGYASQVDDEHPGWIFHRYKSIECIDKG